MTLQANDRRANGLPDRSAEGVINRARLYLAWERIWPLLALPSGIVGLFIAASWFNLFDTFSGLPRLALTSAFLVAFVISCLRLRMFGMPGRSDATAYIDHSLNLPHRPVTSSQDRLAQGSSDAFAEALWEHHQHLARNAARNVRLGLPSPDLARRDPYALRAGLILTLFVAFFYAGHDRMPRLLDALKSPLADMNLLLRGGQATSLADWRLDAWVTPPVYTRLPPVMLSASNQAAAITIPQHSLLVIRVANGKDVSITATGKAADAPDTANTQAETGKPAKPVFEKRLLLTGNAAITVRQQGADIASYTFSVTPDHPPVIAFAGKVTSNSKGQLLIAYKVQDDYGATGIEARMQLDDKGGHPLYEPPALTLPPPAGRGTGSASATRDLTSHALAGARVQMVLTARDGGGNISSSETQDVVLPAPPFTSPLAKALVEQRLALASDAGKAPDVIYALEAMMIAPEDFTPDSGTYLALGTAKTRLQNALTDDSKRDVVDYLWQIANGIEHGSASAAERQLKAAREALRKALEQGASPEEIARLTRELRQALNEFMRDYARRQSQANRQERKNSDPRQKMVTPEQLNKLLEQMEKSAKDGKQDDARSLMSQLDDILDNLAKPETGTAQQDPTTKEMQNSLNELGKMILRQQRLRDQTFKKGQNSPADGRNNQSGPQSGGNQPGPDGPQDNEGRNNPGGKGDRGQQGDNPTPGGEEPGSQGGESGQGELLGQQQNLRKQLQNMQEQLRKNGAGAFGELGQAEQSMRDAESELGQNENENAMESQNNAIEALRKAARELAQQLQQGQKNQGQATRNGGRRDPLGRNKGTYEDNDLPGKGETPDERARRLAEELRRRLADPNRPKEETDYFERLLRQD